MEPKIEIGDKTNDEFVYLQDEEIARLVGEYIIEAITGPLSRDIIWCDQRPGKSNKWAIKRQKHRQCSTCN